MDFLDDLTIRGAIKEVIDILIVSYIVYKLILLVRGTRAVQLLQGIFVVVLAWALSFLFQLNTLQWLMNQMFTYGVMALIIIFQPELRRALEQLGRGRLFGRNKVDEEVNERINELVKTVHFLSRRKIGALIVFERKTGLSDYMETGIPLEAKISSELLINIFIPNTPLHDGAVIIRHDRIMAAGCYLPLSENPFISKELGTRHRAGIGLTEVSDAVSVIVSEETGQISLALNGQIVRDIDEESLISKLHELLTNPTKQKENTNKKMKISFGRWRRGPRG